MIKREHLLASEGEWWKVGEAINQASEILAKALGERPAEEVSEPVEVKLAQVPEMLYSFAIECHLKGILVATFIRSSAQRQFEMEELLKEIMDAPGHVGRNVFMALLLAFLWEKTPKRVEHAKQIAEENTKRINAIKEHGAHQLLRLAEAAQVKLDEDLRVYLDALSDIHQLGRYPAHSRKDVADLSAFIGNKELRDRLNEALDARLEEVIESMPAPDTEQVLLSLGMM